MTEIHNAQFIDDLDFDDTSIDCADLDNKWLDDIEKDNIYKLIDFFKDLDLNKEHWSISNKT